MTPKKPNSAKRKVAKIKIKNKIVICYIPGEKAEIIKNSKILVIPYNVKDLPGVNYKAIRGALDLQGVLNRKTSRSKYGTKKE